MTSRYFSFGCSYVNGRWGGAPDFIGANFTDYYNFGNSGACNSFTLGTIIEVDKLHKFNKDTDFITVGITGFGRFSFIDEIDMVWITAGDILPPDPTISVDSWAPSHNTKSKLFASNIETYSFAVYRSWVAITSMKAYLDARQIKYKIYPSIDNTLFLKEYNLCPTIREKAQEIFDMADVKESIDEFIFNNNWERGIWYKDGMMDSHPTQLHQYKYFQKYFPEFDTDKSRERFEFLESIFSTDSINTQSLDFIHKYVTLFRKDKRLWLR